MKKSPFTGFDPLRESDHWEERTRDVVLHRMQHVPDFGFFTAQEARTLAAAADRIIPQNDRNSSDRIPVAPFIDQALLEGDTDGFRKDGTPWEQEAWKLGLAGLDETSRMQFAADFADLTDQQQDIVLSTVQSGESDGDTWSSLPAADFFQTLVEQVVAVYYAHPSAWAEIGWPGPASMRGYMRTGYGQIDPWQPREARQESSVPLVLQSGASGSTASGSGAAG